MCTDGAPHRAGKKAGQWGPETFDVAVQAAVRKMACLPSSGGFGNQVFKRPRGKLDIARMDCPGHGPTSRGPKRHVWAAKKGVSNTTFPMT